MREAILLGLCLCAFGMLYLYLRSGQFWKCLFFTASTGIAGLLGVLSIGSITTPLLGITPLSFVVSVIMGLPGVVSMLLLNLIWMV